MSTKQTAFDSLAAFMDTPLEDIVSLDDLNIPSGTYVTRIEVEEKQGKDGKAPSIMVKHTLHNIVEIPADCIPPKEGATFIEFFSLGSPKGIAAFRNMRELFATETGKSGLELLEAMQGATVQVSLKVSKAKDGDMVFYNTAHMTIVH
jgi:hypothetical protein